MHLRVHALSYLREPIGKYSRQQRLLESHFSLG
jgi:hypothetical protein